MSENQIYNYPESSLIKDEISDLKRPSALIIVFAILFSIPLTVSQSFVAYGHMGLPGSIVGLIGALIPAFMVVLLFQIGKRFRNSRSRWKIFMWSQVVILLGQIGSILRFIGENA